MSETARRLSPVASARLTNVCRKSWNRTCLGKTGLFFGVSPNGSASITSGRCLGKDKIVVSVFMAPMRPFDLPFHSVSFQRLDHLVSQRHQSLFIVLRVCLKQGSSRVLQRLPYPRCFLVQGPRLANEGLTVPLVASPCINRSHVAQASRSFGCLQQSFHFRGA